MLIYQAFSRRNLDAPHRFCWHFTYIEIYGKRTNGAEDGWKHANKVIAMKLPLGIPIQKWISNISQIGAYEVFLNFFLVK